MRLQGKGTKCQILLKSYTWVSIHNNNSNSVLRDIQKYTHFTAICVLSHVTFFFERHSQESHSVGMHISICVYLYVSIHACTCPCMSICIHDCRYAGTVCMYVMCIHTDTDTCMHTHTYKQAYAFDVDFSFC